MLVAGGRYNGHVRATREPYGGVSHQALVAHTLVSDGQSSDLPATVIHDEKIYDQGAAGACWGFSYAGCAESFNRWRGLPCERVSARAAYALVRAYMLGNADLPLTDTGSDPVTGVEALMRIGCMAEADFPYTDDPTQGLNDRLEEGELEEMALYKLVAFAPIFEQAEQLTLAIRRCLAAKIPVAFAMPVDRAYEDWNTDAAYDGPRGPSLGNHAQRFSGYRPGAFLVTNQWGLGFCQQGRIWLSERFVMSNVFDVFALSASPMIARVG